MMPSLANHSRRVEPLTIAVTIVVLVVCVFFLYLESGRPIDRFWSSEWIVESPAASCQDTELRCPQVGDRVLEIDGVTREQFRADRNLAILKRAPVQMLLQRGDEIWRVGIPRRNDTTVHLWNTLVAACFPLIFWLSGAFCAILVRPRDLRWLVLVAFNYTSALFFAAGIVSETQQAFSSTLTLLSLALFTPLIIHLHLVLPNRAFPGLERWLVPLLYLGSLMLVVSNLQVRTPPHILYLLPIAAIVFSLMLFTVRLIRGGPPEVRAANRLIMAGVAFGLVPWLAALIIVPRGMLSELPFGTHTTVLVAVALLTLPNWPLSYLLAIYRTEAGAIELRANRALGAYAFWSLYVLSFVMLFLVAGALFSFLTEQPLLGGLLLTLPFVALGPQIRRAFQKAVDRRVFGIRYSPDAIARTLASRIPAAVDRDALRRMLVDEVIPQLMIRQSALILLGEHDPELLYAQHVDAEDLLEVAQSADQLFDDDGDNSGQQSFYGRPSATALSWVRATVPLVSRGERLGIWLLGRRDPDDHYPLQDLQSLRLLANQVAALYRSQLEQEENRKLHDQLLHSQKMEAMGRLSAGVAHDFNNLLSAILGYSDLLLGAPGSHDAVTRQFLEGIKEAGDKAAALTSQLLAFSRQQAMETRVVDLNDLLRHLESLLRRVIEEDIALRAELCPEPARVYVDGGQMEQVVLNLAVNASDAMHRGGALTLRTEIVQVTDIEGAGQGTGGWHAEIPAGHYVRLQVQDTGVGISPEILDQVFEPFFTTKRAGKGTGLGLSMVYGIVTQSQGFVRVDSRLERGTTFSIYLPQSSEEPLAKSSSAPHRAFRAPGGETVLLVEDEASVRKVVREILRARGYSVLEAPDGVEGLAVAEAHEGTIDLVLSDVMMPNMRGPQMVEKMRESRPDISVVFMSGYSDERALGDLVQRGEAVLVRKPFTPQTLARELRAVLEGRSQAKRSGDRPLSTSTG